MKAREIERINLGRGKYLSLDKATWQDENGEIRFWEVASRRDIDGIVTIIPKMVPSGDFIFVRQFRVPAGDYVIEFPAGMMEKGESPSEAAQRELQEETGYVADKITVFPESYSSPGIIDEASHLCLVDIDETDARNIDPQQDTDEGEQISVFRVAPEDIQDWLLQRMALGDKIAARSSAFIIGAGLWKE